MEVFILIDLDNFSIVGVFDTLEKAVQAKAGCIWLDIRMSHVR